jgi:hypothetical protein
MSEQEQTPQRATDQLGDRIRRRLLEEGLLKEEQMDRLMPKIKSGRAKAADWKMAIDLSVNEKQR